MIYFAHVRCRGAESRLRPCHPAAGELSRRHEGQEPHPEEPVGLAGRADRGAARGTARRSPGPRRRRAADCARAAARPRAGGAGHGAAPQARPLVAAGAGAAHPAGTGADCRPAARAGVKAGDGARPGRDDGAQLAGRHAGLGPRDGQRDLRHARLAGCGAGGHRGRLGAAPSERRHLAAVRCDIDLAGGTLLPAGAPWLRP
jgi:hypothetical protein